ncbi:hypothetical protein [Candidatus Finniella inopinata]|uniref:Uncharacterized protein n=1 Tax=Candidatus Finniella inopinata TaxID=1696036 RepID=A0A4Q7DH37_9PROT|nr:hypothetical protein [Candidatus Finniella inopinata]RZI45204.1 hypothetical protein EQU50_07940 [Candidatus Finniella inopinata]
MRYKLCIPVVLLMILNTGGNASSMSDSDLAASSAAASKKAELTACIIREGKGQINMRGSAITQTWPTGYDLPLPTGKKYSIQRLEHNKYPAPTAAVLRSWDPANFSDLTTYKRGDRLPEWQLLVHGLELKHLVKGIDRNSLDDFVSNQLNHGVPLGDAFIPYYPYFFHKKTIVSASVISQNLTATFGNAGFVLRAPAENYIFCGKEDIHSPTDKDFYPPVASASSSLTDTMEAVFTAVRGGTVGEWEIGERFKKHRLLSLTNLMPSEKVVPEGMAKAIPISERQSEEQKISDEEIIATAKAMGIPQSRITPQSLQALRQIIANDTPAQALLKGLKERIVEKSWYNEVALNPKRGTAEVLIHGVFLRCPLSNFNAFQKQPYVVNLLAIAEAFDLPVVLINDGNQYETSL